MDTEKTIAIYCRVSTDEQAREGISLEEQQARMQAYTVAMGWKERDVILYVDDGYSAKDLERPQLKKLLKDVQAQEINTVMVTKLDRMSRKLLDLLNLIELFQENNVSFISISEAFDTNQPAGRLTLQVLGAVAEFERERIRERVIENMQHAAKKGKWLTQPPYGYRLIEKELVIEKKEAKLIQDIFEWYVDKGLGFFKIARKLNEHGIPSPTGKEWNNRTVKKLLSNPAYKGTLVWNKSERSSKKIKMKNMEEWIVVEDAVPQIIDKELWETVQKKRDSYQIAPRAQSSPHLLGGLVKCPFCLGGMSISSAGSAKNRYRVYRCSTNKNKGTCSSKTYRANKLEDLFKDGLVKLYSSFQFSVALTRVATKTDSSLKQKITVAEKRYSRKVEAYAAGLINIEILREEKNKLDALKASDHLSHEPNQEVDIKKLETWIKERLKTLRDAIDIVPIEEVKPLLHDLIEKVLVKNEEEIEIVLKALG